MDKISSETGTNRTFPSMTNATEKSNFNEITNNGKRSGGNYGSLGKSQTQPIIYICHKVEADDTMRRLALKYSVNIQEIKKVNKLWSDSELILLEHIFIPVNSSQLAALKTLYPTLNVVSNPVRSMKSTRNSLVDGISTDQGKSFIHTSNSSTSISSLNNNSSFQDYFSKIDQQICTSRKNLQSFHSKSQYKPNESQSNDSQLQNNISNSDESISSQNARTSISNNGGRNRSNDYLQNNNLFVNFSSHTTRDKYVSAALERIQREKDNFDEL